MLDIGPPSLAIMLFASICTVLVATGYAMVDTNIIGGTRFAHIEGKLYMAQYFPCLHACKVVKGFVKKAFRKEK